MPFFLALFALIDILGALGAVLPNPPWSEVVADSLHLGLCALNVAVLSVLTGRTVLCAGGMLWAGALVELVQMHIPGRSASVDDLMTDALGIAVGVVLAWLADLLSERSIIPRVGRATD